MSCWNRSFRTRPPGSGGSARASGCLLRNRSSLGSADVRRARRYPPPGPRRAGQGHPVYDNQQCARPVQERMVWHFLLVEDDLGQNGPREVDGLKMTHCVPNERAVRRR
ncbi:hypothetical protein GCM10010187_16540 [Actinomadura coerulea]|nr:hypothetical protein GCM10010187_16540 [Actinomadura coerulea]